MISLQLNGIQHFVYCPRQWALITLEQVWSENEDTVVGHYFHQIADDAYFVEKRVDRIITRAVPVHSKELGLNGVIDVLEFKRSKQGVRLRSEEGVWMPFVVEYKKGKPKKDLSDKLQLVAQGMCLEEMYSIPIRNGALYYKQTNKREVVTITDELKEKVRQVVGQMREIYESGQTPKAVIGKNCSRCSLKEKCFPRLTHHKRSVVNYIENQWRDIDETIT